MSNRSLLVIIAVVVLICMSSVTFATDVHRHVRNGAGLSAEEAESLEKRLEQNPRDADLRTKLLGYYFLKRYQNQSARDAKRKHILWLILNSPESEILSLPEGQFHGVVDEEAYAEGKKAWIDQIKRNPENLEVLGNSAMFFILSDRELAVESLQKAQSLDGDNPKWPRELGHLYSLHMMTRFSKVNSDAAEKALEQLEKAYELSTDLERDSLLEHLAKAALAACRSEKAKEYAEKMLGQKSSDWNSGNNIHHGNMILGRIAIASGDVEEAKARLIAAGNTPGSPQLNSFGPNMTLAKELLERGETDVVLRYFELCSKFWRDRRGRLDEWSAVIKDGKIPDFAANLRY